MARIGKSTIISHYYKRMKTAKLDYWIIRINLVVVRALLGPVRIRNGLQSGRYRSFVGETFDRC
jgi:hypothetical protein